MKKYFFAAIILMIAAVAIAGQNRVYLRSWPTSELKDQAYDATTGYTTGVTMAQLGTGVSLVGVIDQTKDAPEGAYSLEPGAWKIGYNQAFNTTSTQSTGSSSDSAVTIVYRYGISNSVLSTTQWENLGQSGTTLIGTWIISGTSSPVEFYPEYAGYIGIFAAVPGGPTQFCVPTETHVVWQ